MIVQESLVSMAVTRVTQMIVTAELVPGERITEPPLAAHLGISRPPLREALRILASQGILEQIPRRGYRVVELTPDDVSEIYSLRAALERLALDLLLSDFDADRLAPVAEILDRMREAAEAADAAAMFGLNRDFHVTLVQAAGHRRLAESYERLMLQMHLCMVRNLRREADTHGDLVAGYRRHETLYAALLSADAERVQAAHAAHGERSYLDVKEPVEAEGLTA